MNCKGLTKINAGRLFSENGEDMNKSGMNSRRLRRERDTIAAMVRCYCRAKHGNGGSLCEECSGLLVYANLRLDRCRFGVEKPTCVNCPVHCYQPNRREQVRAVMRFAGPQMLWRHPVLCLFHWIDGFRKAPPLEASAGAEAHSGVRV